MDFWILITDPTNTTKYTEIHSSSRWSSSFPLDMAGTFFFYVPAADPNCAQLVAKRIATCYTIVNGAQVEVGSGIIDQIGLTLDANGNPTGSLTVSGSTRLRELVYRHVGALLIDDGGGGTTTDGPQSIIAFAPSGWALDVINGANVTTKAIYHQFQDESVLTAFVRLAEITGEHFRQGDGQSLVWLNSDVWDAANKSGIRAFYNADPISIEDNDLGVIITRITKNTDSYDNYIGRVYAYGVGDGGGRLTLSGSTNPGAWGGDWTQGSDSKGYYLEHTPTWSTYGIESVMQWKDLADPQTLLESTYEAMRRAQTTLDQYSIELQGLKTTLEPGTTIRVIAHGYTDGYHVVDIDDDLVIMSTTNVMDEQGLRTVNVVCSTVDKHYENDYSIMADQLAQADNFYTHTQPSGSLTGLATSVTAGKTITLAATNNYTLTVNSTGTVQTQEAAATTYLKLDGSNDPMTGNLDLNSVSLNIYGAAVPIEVYRDAGAPTARISAYVASTTNGGRLRLQGAAGTQASPSDVANNYTIGEVQFYGQVNSAMRQGALIRAAMVNTLSSTSYPTRLYFILTLQGATTGTTVMTMHDNGYIGINTSTTAPRGMLGVVARAAADVVSSFKGASSHTGNLTNWEDVSNNILSYIDANGGLVINETGGTTADVRFETDTEANMVFVDASADLMYLGGTTNGVKISKGGDMLLIGTATVFTDLQTTLTSAKITSPSSHIQSNDAENAITFKTTCDTTDYATTNPQMSHGWKVGSNVGPHIHFWQTSSQVPNWLLQYRWQINGSAKTTSWTSVAMNVPIFTYTSGTLNQICDLTTDITPPGGASLSDIIQCRIIRDVANGSGLFSGAEASPVNVDATSFDIHYEIEKLGSSTEYS